MARSNLLASLPPPAERNRVKYRQLQSLLWGAGMAGGDKMFVAPPNSFQLGDKELEVGGEVLD